MRGNNELSLAAKEFQHFIDLSANGILYEYIEDEVKATTGMVFPSRKALKKVIFLVLFTDNRFIGQKAAEPKRIFRDLFPNVYEYLSLIKRGQSPILPRLLQSIEAKIILGRVCYRISYENPYLPIFTIHDSVACPVGYEHYVSKVIKEEMMQAIGLTPTLKCEYWSPDNLHW